MCTHSFDNFRRRLVGIYSPIKNVGDRHPAQRAPSVILSVAKDLLFKTFGS